MTGSFAVIDYVILFAYLLFILWVGIAVAKKEMQGKEFFKGDGSIPWWVTSVSLFATLLSPISFLSLAGNSYLGSWELWFAQLGLFIAVPIAIYYFLPVYRKLNLDTAYEYLERRFDTKARHWKPSFYRLSDWAHVHYYVSAGVSISGCYRHQCCTDRIIHGCSGNHLFSLWRN